MAWRETARSNQLTPDGEWLVWLILAGRGFGKTRTGAEDVAWYGIMNPGSRIAVVAPTYADARDTCIEGDSGLQNVLPRQAIAAWNRSLGELLLTNGTRYKLFSADEPERLRGPQHHRAWCDEVAAWRYPEAWDQLLFGLRLGDDPRIVATTTPRPTPLIRTLVAAPTTHVTRGSTFDNAANLAPAAMAQLKAKYEGTRLGRQELYAEVLDDTPGALWTRAMIEKARFQGSLPAMKRVVVGVDPSGSDGETGDCQGIVVVGLGVDGYAYVLKDASDRLSPEGWASVVATVYKTFGADRVVAERNFGGDMVASVLRTNSPNMPVTLVTASRAKHIRAEPVAALYEQGRVKHDGGFSHLEDQMTLMTTNWFVGKGSPDRLDALVWAITELMLAENVHGAAFLQIAQEDNAARRAVKAPEIIKPRPQAGSVEWAMEQAALKAAAQEAA